MRRGCRWLVAVAVQIVVVLQTAKVVEMQLGKVRKMNFKYSIVITNQCFLPFWTDARWYEVLRAMCQFREISMFPNVTFWHFYIKFDI